MGYAGYIGPSVGAVSYPGSGPVKERSVGSTSSIKAHPVVAQPKRVGEPGRSRLSGVHRSGKPKDIDPHRVGVT